MINYKQLAIGELKEYNAKVVAIPNLREKIADIEERMHSIRPGLSDSTPVQGGGNRVQESMVNAIAQRDTLKHTLRIVTEQVEGVERGLAVLNARQKRILEIFYIYRAEGFVDRACRELCVEKSRLYEEKDEALRIYTIARYGLVEL